MKSMVERRTPEQKFITLFEAAKRSLLATIELHCRLTSDLRTLEGPLESGEDIGDSAISPLLSAVSFVDFAHRFGALIDALPLLKKNAPELRALHSAIAPVERARNHLQHLRGDLSSNEPIRYSLLGELCWTNAEACYFLALTDPHEVKHVTIAYDASKQRWAETIRYSVRDIWVNVDKVLDEMRKAFDWVCSKSAINDPQVRELKWGMTIGGAFRISIETPSLLNPFMFPPPRLRR
jgi:hypothetical protein